MKTRTLERIKKNFATADIAFTENEFQSLEDELSKTTIYGNRTDKDIAKLKEWECCIQRTVGS